MDENLVLIRTRPCCMCGKVRTLAVPEAGLLKFQTGTKVQHAFPDMSAADRELLISGTCDPCFKQLFPPEED